MTMHRKVKPRAVRASAWRNCEACGYGLNADRVDLCPHCKAPLPKPAQKPKREMRHWEDQHQELLFDWASKQVCVYPDLDLLFAVPNGGTRNTFEVVRLKKQGLRPGYPDVGLDVARGGYTGLRIELKATREELGRKPQPSAEQRTWLDRLTAEGMSCHVCEGWDRARAILIEYLSKPKTRDMGWARLREERGDEVKCECGNCSYTPMRWTLDVCVPMCMPLTSDCNAVPSRHLGPGDVLEIEIASGRVVGGPLGRAGH